jgi:hypothetical protein
VSDLREIDTYEPMIGLDLKFSIDVNVLKSAPSNRKFTGQKNATLQRFDLKVFNHITTYQWLQKRSWDISAAFADFVKKYVIWSEV